MIVDSTMIPSIIVSVRRRPSPRRLRFSQWSHTVTTPMEYTIRNDRSSTSTGTTFMPPTSSSSSMVSPPPTISILGAGSIGLLFASMIRCTYPSYPIQLLLRPTSSLLISSSSSSSSLPSSKQKLIHVCLQQTFSVTKPPSQSPTKFWRRRLASQNSPRIVPVPYEIIDDDDDDENDNRKSYRPLRQHSDSYIFVTTKAYQALDAIRSIHHRLFNTCADSMTTTTTTTATTTSIHIVVCCNGALAVVEMIQQYLQDEVQRRRSMDVTSLLPPPPPRIYYGIITHGAYREPPVPPERPPTVTEPDQHAPNGDNDDDETLCHVIHAGNGSITILPHNDPNSSGSSHNSTIDDIVHVLETSGLNCQWNAQDDTLLWIWKKLAVSCVINPLTVIYHCHNGALLQNDDTDENAVVVVPDFQTRYLDPICDEIAQLYVVVNAAALGVDIITTTSPKSSRHHGMEQIERISTIMRDYVVQVIRDTAMNRSSTYQDVYMSSNDKPHQMPLTEMDYFNGYIIAKSQQYQLECPANQKVVQEFYHTIHAWTKPTLGLAR